jgi:hypothetical protein
MNVLIEMTALDRNRPAPDAPPEIVAAWYEAKARLHEHIAAVGGPDAAQASAWATAAHEHARGLLLVSTVVPLRTGQPRAVSPGRAA